MRPPSGALASSLPCEFTCRARPFRASSRREGSVPLPRRKNPASLTRDTSPCGGSRFTTRPPPTCPHRFGSSGSGSREESAGPTEKSLRTAHHLRRCAWRPNRGHEPPGIHTSNGPHVHASRTMELTDVWFEGLACITTGCRNFSHERQTHARSVRSHRFTMTPPSSRSEPALTWTRLTLFHVERAVAAGSEPAQQGLRAPAWTLASSHDNRAGLSTQECSSSNLVTRLHPQHLA